MVKNKLKKGNEYADCRLCPHTMITHTMGCGIGCKLAILTTEDMTFSPRLGKFDARPLSPISPPDWCPLKKS